MDNFFVETPLKNVLIYKDINCAFLRAFRLKFAPLLSLEVT